MKPGQVNSILALLLGFITFHAYRASAIEDRIAVPEYSFDEIKASWDMAHASSLVVSGDFSILDNISPGPKTTANYQLQPKVKARLRTRESMLEIFLHKTTNAIPDAVIDHGTTIHQWESEAYLELYFASLALALEAERLDRKCHYFAAGQTFGKALSAKNFRFIKDDLEKQRATALMYRDIMEGRDSVIPLSLGFLFSRLCPKSYRDIQDSETQLPSYEGNLSKKSQKDLVESKLRLAFKDQLESLATEKKLELSGLQEKYSQAGQDTTITLKSDKVFDLERLASNASSKLELVNDDKLLLTDSLKKLDSTDMETLKGSLNEGLERGKMKEQSKKFDQMIKDDVLINLPKIPECNTIADDYIKSVESDLEHDKWKIQLKTCIDRLMEITNATATSSTAVQYKHRDFAADIYNLSLLFHP